MILVAGPPCGGKTTYVRANAIEGDSILDFDDIIEELSGDRYTDDAVVIEQARAEWGKRLLTSPDWVIWTAPRRAERGRFRSQWGALVIVVITDMEECLRRAADTRPQRWQGLIRQWFAQWEPSRSGSEGVVVT